MQIFFVYIYRWKVKVFMFSPMFMRFIISRELTDFLPKEKESNHNFIENKIYRYSKFATIPVEIRK